MAVLTAQDPDNINSSGSFNTPGERFGADLVVDAPTHYLRQLPESEVPLTPIVPTRRTISTFVPETSQTVSDDAPAEIRREAYTGNFSICRAIRVSHQHLVGLWSAANLITLFGQSDVADPTEEELKQGWEDHQLFSYLPPALALSEDTYRQMSQPQRRKAVLRDALANQGMTTVVGSGNVATPVVTNALLAEQTPFAESNLSYCEQRLRDLVEG